MTSYRLLKSTTALLLVVLTLTSCGGTPEQKEARYLKRGDKLMALGQYDKARVEFMNAARLKPTDPNAIYHLGLVEDAEGNLMEAFTRFTVAEQQDRHFHPALLKLAEYYLAGGQVDQANARIDLVLSESPDDPEARALLAARYLHQHQTVEAETEAKKALAIDPKNVLAYGILSGVYRLQNDMPKAIATIEDGVNHVPHDPSLLHMKAELYEQQGDLQKATEAYEALFAAAPSQIKYRLQLADDNVRAGQLDQAEAVLREGTAALPDDWEMKHQLVMFLDAHRGVTVAEHELQSYVKANPDRTEPVDWLVSLYISHNMMDKAEAFLNEIIGKNKGDHLWCDAMTSMARIDYLKGNADEGDKLLQAVLAKEPNNLNAEFLKAHIEADAGNYEQAIIDLRGIIRDAPKSKDAYELLGEILLRQGHTDLAIDTFNQLSEHTPLTTQDQVRLAQFYALNNDPKHAMDLLTTATKADPGYSVGWETTARLALDLKDWATADTAIKMLDGIKDQHPTALLLQGEEQALNNKIPEAIATYIEVIKLDTSSPQAEHALPALVGTYASQKQLPEAAATLQSFTPPTVLINTLLGQCYVSMNEPEKAAGTFDMAIAEKPKTQDPFIERAKLYLAEQKPAEALSLLKQADLVNPSDMRAPLASAQIMEMTGDNTGAIALYKALLARYPDNNVVANNIAELIADHTYTDPQQLEQARQIAERFTASKNPLLLDTLAWVYFRQGRLDDALAIFARLPSMIENLPPQSHYHYGAALAAANRKDQAIVELKQAVVPGDNYAGHEDAAKLLADLSVAH